jgi:hypothetical protein
MPPPPKNAQAPLEGEAKRKELTNAEPVASGGVAQLIFRAVQLLAIACRELAEINSQLKRLADSRESERQFWSGS